jgi:hypothetical protein
MEARFSMDGGVFSLCRSRDARLLDPRKSGPGAGWAIAATDVEKISEKFFEKHVGFCRGDTIYFS